MKSKNYQRMFSKVQSKDAWNCPACGKRNAFYRLHCRGCRKKKPEPLDKLF